MKKLLSISLIVVFAFIALSFTAKAEIVKPTAPEKVELTADAEALYCSVTIGTRSASCWFCNCNDLANTLIANQ